MLQISYSFPYADTVTEKKQSTTTPSSVTADRVVSSVDLAWFIPVVVIATVLVAIAFFVSLFIFDMIFEFLN